MNDTQHDYKAGYVTISGRANVGKSTLLNYLMGQKISIVTPKPQTTRDRILAIHNRTDAQIVFVDTPGLHKPRGSLGRYMNETANSAIMDADLCLWLLDAADPSRDKTPNKGLTPAEKHISETIQQANIPTVAAVNKVDIVTPKSRMLPLLNDLGCLSFLKSIFPISAKTGDGVDNLLNEIVAALPISPRLFPENMLSDRADRFFTAELIREAIIHSTQKEVPYRTAVVIDRFEQHLESVDIHASIHVETRGQKKIIIGKGGDMIGTIRKAACAEIFEILKKPVTLHLHVDISPDWSTNQAGLRKMGYQ